MKNVLVAIVTLFSVVGIANAEQFTSQIHFVELSQPQPVETGDKIEVRELFWYGCQHCYDLEPALDKWLKNKPANAEFVRMAAVLRESWAPHARAFYTFEALGVMDTLHPALFKALHVKKKRLDTAAALADFAAEHGVAREKFISTYNSFAVDSKFRQARIQGRRYQARGVPSIIVDGRYLTTATMAGSHGRLMQIVDFLVKKAAAERLKPAA